MERVWWKHGVVYQIYPRSFADHDGDGVGDLRGILDHVDHLAFLGVDAIWLSPTFPSPMKDFGYDVADYCDVDPVFGSLDDMDALVAACHARGIKVMLDFVPNHTSDHHPWFVSSRRAKDSPHRGYYVWRPGRPDGSPPNNWVSYFGGPAWTLDEATGEYYLHSFLKEQPDLDWRNPDVERAMHDALRFWLDRGIDGFRIDVVHKIAKDPALRDNPPIEGGKGYTAQLHVHDENHPDVHGILKRVRGVLDAYRDRATVGEVYIFNPAEVASYYGDDDELHLAFNFAFLRSTWTKASFAEEIQEIETLLAARGWPVNVLSNHDVVRHATRYGDVRPDARARAAALLLLTLRGTPFLYAGEELGLREVAIPDDRRQDPVFWTLGPEFSRDGCRAPFPWTAGPHGGFTTGSPWLPLGPDVAVRNREALARDPSSILHLYRDLIALRKRTPALAAGSLALVDAGRDALAWERRDGESRARVVINFGEAPLDVELGAPPSDGLVTRSGARLAARVTLGPDEGLVACFTGARPSTP